VSILETETPLPAAAAIPGALLDCPECGVSAVITDRFTLAGSPAPVTHVRIECLAGHWFTEPADRVVVT
jgi:hypothetical protein